jgi:hypothetical protein
MSLLLRYLVLVLTLSVCLSANAASGKWEYLTKSINLLTDAVMTQQLNKLGKENWELVDCSAAGSALVCIFKRKI